MNGGYFADMLDVYLPAKTRVIWTSKPGQCLLKLCEPLKSFRYESNRTLLQWLDAANRILYEKMRERFLLNDRSLMFFDLLEMSVPLMTAFAADGLHMNPIWYRHVMSYMMQTLCNE